MKNHKLIVLALIMLAAFMDGVTHQFFSPGAVLGKGDIAFTVIASLLIFVWYRLDSDQLSYRKTPLLNVSVVALGVVALPYYLFRSRGISRGSIAVAIFVVLVGVYFALQSAGQYAVYHLWQS